MQRLLGGSHGRLGRGPCGSPGQPLICPHLLGVVERALASQEVGGCILLEPLTHHVTWAESPASVSLPVQ